MNKLALLNALVTKDVPIYVHYGITHRCNLRCRMCGVWKTGDVETELTISQIRQMAGVLKTLGTQVISIGGGEPLIRDDLPKAAAAFIENGISTRVLTNGVIDDLSRLDRLMEAGVRDFSVSLDTLDPEVQNDIIGRKDAFGKIMATIDHLSPRIKKKKGLGLINTVVSAANTDQLKPLVEFAGKKGFYVSFIPLEMHTFSGKVLGCGDIMEDLSFQPDDRKKIRGIYDELIELKSSGSPIFNSTTFLKSSRDYLSGKECEWDCRAGSLYFSISPEGLFSMCHRYCGYSLEGNRLSILSDDFLKIFHSSMYKDAVKKIQSNCHSCLRPCWVEISNLFLDFSAMLEMLRIQYFKKK